MKHDAAGTSPDWSSLGDALAGEVALPGSSVYDRVSVPFNARFLDRRPQAIVLCAAPEDVAETIAFLGRHGVDRVPRSGGHCFAGHSSSRGAVIDVTPMGAVSVSGEVACIGAGARLGTVYDGLQRHGLAIPAGTCPSVGIAGLALGGGLGILGRCHGLTSDRLVGAQIVLADGRILDCDEHHHADLFWALRGAGAGNFGVVTRLDFRTVPAPVATNLHATWTPAQAGAVIEAWQEWAPGGPDELAASLKVTASGDTEEPPSVDVYAAFLGSESTATELLDGLAVRAGADPASAFVASLSFPDTRRFWAQLGVAEEGTAIESARHDVVPPDHLVARSEFFRRPLPGDAIAALVRTLTRDRRPGESRELDFMPWGGAYNRVPADATAFVHRAERFQLKHAAVVGGRATASAAAAAHRWVNRSWTTVHPWGSGRVFQNFADADLDDWAHAYHGTNYRRLVDIKARYDPRNAFRFPQSLPVT
jgi:FAD/FMN-containing dehydrogenase